MDVDVEPRAETHVVLGTGQVGVPVARELSDHGVDVRVVNRSGAVPDPIDGSVGAVQADVSDPSQAREACAGATVVYFCLQPPYHEWPELFPPLLEGAIAGAEAADARFVMADNLYAYGPVEGPIHEGLAHGATTEKGRIRAAMAETVLDADESGRIDATIGRASDFYGPGVTGSIVGERVFPRILAGKTVWFPGDPDAPHTYTYIEDFARELVTLGAHETALGEVWHVPSAETLTTREFLGLAAEAAGTDPTVRSVPGPVVRLAGYVSPTLGQLSEIRYQFEDPFEVDHGTFDERFDLSPTPHREGIARTIEWYRTEY